MTDAQKERAIDSIVARSEARISKLESAVASELEIIKSHLDLIRNINSAQEDPLPPPVEPPPA